MKKLFIFLLFTVLLFEKYANTQTCEVDRAIESKIEKIIASTESSYQPKVQLYCKNVIAQGGFASCPTGYIPTSCSCGMLCGAWNIRAHDLVCRCKCPNIDWTAAWCCKVSTDGY
ncbi:resistin-like [Thamnophis elegans]|uniref:resistin-like n=1 Tax=Thamnophis elegans TaxID=35005 RepID=UPI0013771F65|nr:resistin-like [Thamnophis elegans]